MRILFIGDVVGEPGRRALTQLLPRLIEEDAPDFVIANAENAAGGTGITRETAAQVFAAGVDAITLGNHAWAKKESYQYIDQEQRIVRPANYPPGVPGRGWSVFRARNDEPVGVVSLCGCVFMDNLDSPFRTADDALRLLSLQTDAIIVDFHGEATSEKGAFAWHMDGRVSAVIGTHTHVQTADERILPGGTAFITDTGMTGPVDSVIGVNKETVIGRFLNHMPAKFEVAEGPAVLSGVIVDTDHATGKAVGIERFQRII